MPEGVSVVVCKADYVGSSDADLNIRCINQDAEAWEALAVAELAEAISCLSTELPARALGARMKGMALHVLGRYDEALSLADNDAQIINMSFGLLERDKMIEDALSYAYSRVYMVAAAGNDNLDTLHFPADRSSKTLAVTATNAINDIRAPFANFNKDVQVSAPGVNLYSAYPGNRWATWSGTSFSASLVAGEAVLLLQLDPTLNCTAMNSVITTAGVNIDALSPAYAQKLGRVRIDYLDAVNQILTGN